MINNIDNIYLTIRRNCGDCEIIVNHILIIRMFKISVEMKSRKKITRKVVCIPEIILDKNNSKCRSENNLMREKSFWCNRIITIYKCKNNTIRNISHCEFK